MALNFKSSPSLTLGVELELQLVDRAAKDLFPISPLIFEKLGEHPKIKPEIFQSMVEINTGICKNISEIKADLSKSIQELRELCNGLNCDLVSAGSHPFSQSFEHMIYPSERFQLLIDRNQWLAKRLTIFGMHVHLGMKSGEHAMAMINGLLHYLPYFLAISASSPFWRGKDTGLASSRITIFESLPTSGSPCIFETWAAFEDFFDVMINSKTIGSIKDLWWDIRPQPDFGTIEVRICDMRPSFSEIISLISFIHCLAYWLEQKILKGEVLVPPTYWMLRENKWHASRWGIEGKILVDTHGKIFRLREAIKSIVSELKTTSIILECEDELADLGRQMDLPMSYDRQRKIFNETKSLEKVVDSLIEEFRDGAVGQPASH